MPGENKVNEDLLADLKRQVAALEAERPNRQTNVETTAGRHEQPSDPYAPTAWGSNEYDFTVPSGQLCRMRKLRPEELIKAGLLDKVSQLPAYAEELVQKAEGVQPQKQSMPTAGELEQLVDILDKLLPLVVVRPKLWPAPAEDEPRVPGRVYVDDVELGDRIAIMERAMGGVAKYENFRQES